MTPFVASILELQKRYAAKALNPEEYKDEILQGLAENLDVINDIEEIKIVLTVLKGMAKDGLIEQSVVKEVYDHFTAKLKEAGPAAASGRSEQAGPAGQGDAAYAGGPRSSTAQPGAFQQGGAFGQGAAFGRGAATPPPVFVPGFSVGAAIRFGWETTKANLLLLIGLLVGYILVATIVGLVLGLLFAGIGAAVGVPFLGAVGGLGNIIVSLLLQIVFLLVLLHFADNQQPYFSMADVKASLSLFLPFLVANILVALSVCIGMALLIIPGFYLSVKLCLSLFFVADRRMGPIEAMKASYEATTGHFWDLFLLYLALFGINILGMLALGIGMLVTMPLAMIAFAWTYRQLAGPAQA